MQWGPDQTSSLLADVCCHTKLPVISQDFKSHVSYRLCLEMTLIFISPKSKAAYTAGACTRRNGGGCEQEAGG